MIRIYSNGLFHESNNTVHTIKDYPDLIILCTMLPEVYLHCVDFQAWVAPSECKTAHQSRLIEPMYTYVMCTYHCQPMHTYVII